MSEKKKVIYVKDLVIKADNVRIEPSRSHRPDPFFGPRQTLGETDEREHRHEKLEDIADDHHDHDHEDKDNDRDDDRKPFSWL